MSNIIIFNRLNETQYGILGFEITTYTVLSVILSLGVDTNYVRKSRNVSSRSKSLFNYTIIIKVLLIAFSFPIFLIIFLIRKLTIEELFVVFLSYGGRCFFNLFVAFFSTLNVRWKAGIGDLLREGALLSVIILMQIQDFFLFLFLIALCELFGLLILLILSINSLLTTKGDNLISWKVLFDSSIKLTILQILTYSTIYACMFFLSNYELGIFTFANSFSGMLGIITMIIATTVFPHYTSIINFKTWKECIREVVLHTATLVGMSLLILVVIILIPHISPLKLILTGIGIIEEIFIVILILAIYYLLTSIVVPIYRFSLVVGWDKEVVLSSFLGMSIQIFSLIIFAKFAFIAGISLILGMSMNLILLWLLVCVKMKKNNFRFIINQ
ncbi:MAG: hypothetical protein ACFE9S_09555 [Candidatus Hermodarchaeota archaeon]